jgi:hypothetical protein
MSSIIKVNTFQDANGNALFSSDGSGNVTTSASGLQNTPSFSAILSSNQLIPNTTHTKVQLDTEQWDSNSAFDVSNNRFTVPSGQGGKYLMTYCVATEPTWEDEERAVAKLYKNGSGFELSASSLRSSKTSMEMFLNNTVCMDLSVGDYVELYFFHDEGANNYIYSAHTILSGYKLIGA